MKILALVGDHYHPAQVPVQGLEPLKAQFALDIVEDGFAVDATLLRRYDVVLLSKSDCRTTEDNTPWLTPERQAALDAYVANGGGLLAVHSGIAGYNDNEGMRTLLGALFAWHPAQLEVALDPAQGHPLCQGVAAFAGMDEHYFVNRSPEAVEVFLTSRSRHGSVPAGWTRRHGAGRVAVLTPGHNVEMWWDANFQQLLANTLRWCGEKE